MTPADRQRRRLARRLHPDLGGDHDAYVAAMAELDGGAGHAADGPLPVVVRSRWRRLTRLPRTALRRVRRRRRYARL